MATSGTLGILIICGFFALMVAFFGLFIYFARQEQAKKEKFASELGFSALAEAETRDLLERLAAIHEYTRLERLYLLHVFRRSAGGGQVYWYSLHQRSHRARSQSNPTRRSSSSPVETSAFAFVTSAWNLPGFKVTPRFAGEGKFAAVANQLAEKVVETFANRYEFPDIPGLDEKYFIASIPGFQSGGSPQDLPEAFLRALAASPGLSVHAGGDILSVSLASSLDRNEEKIRQLYKTGIQLVRGLSA